MATYADMEELIRLGAYRPALAEVDEAIRLPSRSLDFLGQGKEEATTLAQAYLNLKEILGPTETD